jgi:hypothetical protein
MSGGAVLAGSGGAEAGAVACAEEATRSTSADAVGNERIIGNEFLLAANFGS